ncbi:GntR family transcriptional regulator [Spirillospora sp. CA-294931]|uniref:GntR family transcriptional regulator n=1 Tax=Spirillospora sp. CA-294931 TaxID=3240042 RepID=UPI003D9251C3
MLQVDKGSPVPMYQQLKDQVRALVDSGRLTAGTRLPSERRLIAEVGASRITVRQALRDLVAEGYLTSAAGKGFFVAGRAAPQDLNALLSHTTAMRAVGVRPSSRVLACLVQPASPATAAGLGLASGADVVHLVRVRLGDGVPLTLQRVWLPADLVPGLVEVDFTHASLFEQLRERFGIRTARAETTVGSRIADADEAAALELPDPPVALTVDQVTYDDTGRIVELSHSLHHPRRLPLRITHTTTEAGHAAAVTAGPSRHA